MPRYRLTVAYDGRPFHGWQRQEDGQPSVQQTLEDALFVLTKVRTTVHGGGRTDAGVHALRQGAHIELPAPIDPRRLADGLNGIMRPAPVAVLNAAEAAPHFHARFSAVRRRYRYRILNRRAPPTVEAGFVWHHR
ncbi:MAG: tRNA pseudouridine synthase A, partial [Pseudomonadota bacterium]